MVKVTELSFSILTISFPCYFGGESNLCSSPPVF